MDSGRKLGAREIVSRAGMSDRPGFYSGRGAIISDLNDAILEKIYQGISCEYGEESADQYAQMVAVMPKLSATDFLLTLYRLEANGWVWDARILPNTNGIYPDSEGSAFATVVEVLFGSGERDETPYIRGGFLRRHGIESEETRSSKSYFLD